MNNKCLFTMNGICCNHKKNKGYGGYCKKHRKEYLLKDGLLILDRFTSNEKDYTLAELKKYYIRNVTTEKLSKFKKMDFFNEIKGLYIQGLKNTYNSNNLNFESLVIKLQSFIRKILILKKINYQGIAILNRNICNNDEDFYTYEPKSEIESKYFFSYKDTHSNYWCFDIRSLKKLIDMNYNNPYTTEPIPESVKQSIQRYIQVLKKKRYSSNY